MSKRTIKQKLFEVSIRMPAKPDAALEIVRMLLVQLGIPLGEIIEQDIDGRKELSFYSSTLKHARVLQGNLCRLKWLKKYVHVDVLYQDDWLTRWKKDWKPFRLTPRIDVVPVWCRKDYKPGRRTFILLDTVSSFGTGLHETTRFMSEIIGSLRGKFRSFLDIGTGTGILALVALKSDARAVEALDYDDMCVQAAKANFKANGVSNVLVSRKDIGKYRSKNAFDLVCANLVTHDLVRFKENICACVKPGGWLAVSGVSLENLPALRRGFKDLPLKCVKIKKGRKWSALLFKRISTQDQELC